MPLKKPFICFLLCELNWVFERNFERSKKVNGELMNKVRTVNWWTEIFSWTQQAWDKLNVEHFWMGFCEPDPHNFEACFLMIIFKGLWYSKVYLCFSAQADWNGHSYFFIL